MPFDFPDPQIEPSVVNPETGTPYVYDFVRQQWVYDADFNPDLDQRYVKVIGDTMTGPLNLHADPQMPLVAATKQYVDERIKRSGDTMSGTLTLGDPDRRLDVEFGALGHISYSGNDRIKWGDTSVTFSGDVSITSGKNSQGITIQPKFSVGGARIRNVGEPTALNDAVTKKYLDEAIDAIDTGDGTSMPEPPADGKVYGRKNPLIGAADWEEIDTSGGGGSSMPEPPNNNKLYSRKTENNISVWQQSPTGVRVVGGLPSIPERGMIYLTSGNQLFVGI